MSGCTRQIDAMRHANVPIETLCIHSKYVVFRGGLKMPIRYIDEGGKLIDGPDDAVAYEFGNPEFGFATVEFDYYEDYELLGEYEH